MVRKMEQILWEDGELFTVASGISMLPCIRPQRDILHLVRPERAVEKYEVILYQRNNGAYILHRVMGKDQRGYILCGDHQWVFEHGIREDQVLGVLKGFYRGETYIDCTENRLYRSYVRIWCASLQARKWVIRLENLGRRGLTKLRWEKSKKR